MNSGGAKRSTRYLVTTSLFALTLTPLGHVPATGAVKESPVRNTKAAETGAVYGNGYLAWMQAGDRGHDTDILLRSPSGRVTRVNSRGTHGELGGMDGPRLVYQEYVGQSSMGYGRHEWSRLRILNVKTHQRRTLKRLNSRAWEYMPSISRNKLMYGRVKGQRRTLRIYNLRTGDDRRATYGYLHRDDYLQPGQINGGRYITYLTWWNVTPSVSWRDIKTGKGKSYGGSSYYNLWAPSVGPDGTLYYLEAGRRCGQHPVFVRWRIDDDYGLPGDPEVLTRLPHGIEASRSYTYFENGIPHVLYDRARCKNFYREGDIYQAIDAYRLNVEIRGKGSGSVTSKALGIACPGDCSHMYRTGRHIELRAKPEFLSRFAGWSRNCYPGGQNRVCEISVDRTRNISATFDIGAR